MQTNDKPVAETQPVLLRDLQRKAESFSSFQVSFVTKFSEVSYSRPWKLRNSMEQSPPGEAISH
jgi:hypothetical protein